MYSVRIPVQQSTSGEDALEHLIAELWEAGTEGINEGPGYIEAFFSSPDVARAFGEPFPVAEVDWQQDFEARWPALEVGERFFVVPPWNQDPTPEGRFRLVINPADQCGTGQHPCTQACLVELERHLQPGASVLDVGSGSGILSIAAKMLGAGRVIACDIDPNTAKTGPLLASYGVPLYIGGVESAAEGFDLVVANISEAVLGPMLPELERVGRRLILSGFQDDAGEWVAVVKG